MSSLSCGRRCRASQDRRQIPKSATQSVAADCGAALGDQPLYVVSVTPWLLEVLADPMTGHPLELVDALSEGETVVSGFLQTVEGLRYPIVDGVPRFEMEHEGVHSFGEEWNFFNFVDFKPHWLNHVVANTFGSTDVFAGKTIVDAGAGSGAQALWMLEAGAKHVIALELSHAVDGVMRRNLAQSRFTNYDVVQCSIDRPPLRPASIDGLVICHNVIQHAKSVEQTARALFAIVAPGSELVFNCYHKNDEGVLRWMRFHLVYRPVRGILRRAPFSVRLWYSRLLAAFRLVPAVGVLAEKAGLMVAGDVPAVCGIRDRLRRRYRAGVLNTFDGFGGHAYQHHRSKQEIMTLVESLRPSHVLNAEAYFRRPPPVGVALRLVR